MRLMLLLLVMELRTENWHEYCQNWKDAMKIRPRGDGGVGVCTEYESTAALHMNADI